MICKQHHIQKVGFVMNFSFLFSAECTIGMVWELTSLKRYGSARKIKVSNYQCFCEE